MTGDTDTSLLPPSLALKRTADIHAENSTLVSPRQRRSREPVALRQNIVNNS